MVYVPGNVQVLIPSYFRLPYYPSKSHGKSVESLNSIHLAKLMIWRITSQAINIEGLSLDKFLEHQVANSGWALEKGQGKGQLIRISQNEFNHPELKKNAAESIPLEHITRIFPILG